MLENDERICPAAEYGGITARSIALESLPARHSCVTLICVSHGWNDLLRFFQPLETVVIGETSTTARFPNIGTYRGGS